MSTDARADAATVPPQVAPQVAHQVAHLILYARAWCHLCDDMRAALEPLLVGTGARLEVIDVDSDPVLCERYDELVPVLVCDGVELCHYRLDESRVRAALARPLA